MNRLIKIPLLLISLSLFLAACGPEIEEPHGPSEDATAIAMNMPAAEGAALTQYVLETNNYRSWGTWETDAWNDFSGNLVSGAPHGNVVRIFANDTALAAVQMANFSGSLPFGSIIVKENYMGTDPADPGELDALTIMYKVEGFNPDNNDWFWLKVSGDGSAIAKEGIVAGCIGCHSQPNNHDYLLRYGFGDEPAIPTLRPAPLPDASGDALTAYILETNNYRSWGTWETDAWNDFSGNLVSGAPHGNVVRVFVNNIALKAITMEEFSGSLPFGSIIVKENYMGTDPADPGELDALTIMYKVEGFNPDNNDWFWLKVSGDGSAIAKEGIVAGCIGCHSQPNNHDYLLRYGFGDEPAIPTLREGDGEDMDSGDSMNMNDGLTVSTIDLAFEQANWSATAGETINVSFQNNGNLQHAFAVVKEGSELGGNESYNAAKHEENLLFHSGAVNGGSTFTGSFTAPDPGTYQVICTLPGHYPTMNGELVITAP